jgi:cell division transport system permease protein
MAFLAALALAGFVGAAALAQHWEQGAEAALTVQVPQPNALALTPSSASPGSVLPGSSRPGSTANPTRLDRVLGILRGAAGIRSVHALSADELASLLRPWLGPALGGMALPMPAVIDVRLGDMGLGDVLGGGPTLSMTELAAQIDAAAPGSLVESHGAWVRRLSVLAHSVQACTAVSLLLVILVAVAVVAIATRAGLAARREAIEIVHGLGASDGYIAGRFARRAMRMAALGGLCGAVAALPVLLWLAELVAPFGGLQEDVFSDTARIGSGWLGVNGLSTDWLAMLPRPLWEAMPLLPLVAAAIGWLTAQGTVRRWLRRLP